MVAYRNNYYYVYIEIDLARHYLGSYHLPCHHLCPFHAALNG